MERVFFQGSRLCLRAVEPEDLDFMYMVENDADNWEVTDFTSPYSRFALRQYIENSQCDIYVDRQLRLMVAERVTGHTVGIVDISDFSPLHARGEVGILVARAYRGLGYGREALTLLCDYAFGFLAFHQLVARIPVDNEASLRLFRSCGFVACGLLKEWWHAGDTFKDVVMLQRLHHMDS